MRAQEIKLQRMLLGSGITAFARKGRCLRRSKVKPPVGGKSEKVSLQERCRFRVWTRNKPPSMQMRSWRSAAGPQMNTRVHHLATTHPMPASAVAGSDSGQHRISVESQSIYENMIHAFSRIAKICGITVVRETFSPQEGGMYFYAFLHFASSVGS